MRTSAGHILTSHAGSLSRPDALVEANRMREARGTGDEQAFQHQLHAAVGDVVRRQKELGIDIPGDGEFGKSMGQRVNYGAWRSYSFQRLGGLDFGGPNLYDSTLRRSRPGAVVLTNFADRRDRARFAAAYADPDSGTSMGVRAAAPTCVGPLTYIGHEAIKADIVNFMAALASAGVEEGFMTSVGPASCSRIGNAYYKTDEEFVYACAEAMRGEYKAILRSPRIGIWSIPRPPSRTTRNSRWSGSRRSITRSAGCRRSGSAFTVLGQLARPAYDRHSDARHRPCDAGDQCAGLLVRGRQCPPRA